MNKPQVAALGSKTILHYRYYIGFCLLLLTAGLMFTLSEGMGNSRAQKLDDQITLDSIPEIIPTPPVVVNARCSTYAAPQPPNPPTITYYVNSATGNDSSNGLTAGTAWKTLNKANSMAVPGALFNLRGTFVDDDINPAQSGTSANRIIYRNEPGQTALLNSTSGSSEYGIYLVGKSYVVVDGIEIANGPSHGAFEISGGGSDNWLRNLYIHDSGSSTFRFNTDRNRLEDSVLVNIGSAIDNAGDALVLIEDNDDNVIVRNYFGNAGHAAYDETLQGGTTGQDQRNIVAQNIFENFWATNVVISGRSDSVLIECNDIRNSATNSPNSGLQGGGIQYSGDNGIIRYNIIRNGKQDGITIQGYTFHTFQNQFPENNHFYNNTVVGNGRTGLFIGLSDNGNGTGNNAFNRNNKFENNIFWGNAGTDPGNGLFGDIMSDQHLATNPWGDPPFADGNLIRYNNFSNVNPLYMLHRVGFPNVILANVAALAANYPLWTNNQQNNPNFTNAPGGVFTLQNGSPMIDAGMVISGQTYTGSAPDLGAFEGGSPPPPPPPPPPASSAGTVVWQDVQSSSSVGGTVQHTGSQYFAMAKSTQTISSSGGYFEWTYNGYLDLWVGLGNNNDEVPGNGDDDLSYSFSGSIREFGIYKADGNPAFGDRLKIEITSGTVRFKKNGVTMYTSSTTASGSYYLVFKAQQTAGKKIANASVNAPGTRLFDYDRDGRADLSIFRPSSGLWAVSHSNNIGGYSLATFGLSSDVITSGDFDGDQKADIGVFRPSAGYWYILNSADSTVTYMPWGMNGDIPVPGDYDADRKTDFTVWRPSDGTWYVLRSSDGGYVGFQFGLGTDRPAVGDYDGDKKNDFAVYRPSSGMWYINRSSDSGFSYLSFGIATDKIVPADYDGDGKTDISVYRPSEKTWYRMNSGNGQFYAASFGIADQTPVPADYDGDGKADLAVFQNATGDWNIIESSTGTPTLIHWGLSGDRPIPSIYVK